MEMPWQRLLTGGTDRAVFKYGG